MLKNDAGALPILGGKLAVIGPLADAAADMRGCWAAAGLPKDCISVLDGLRAALPGQGDRLCGRRGHPLPLSEAGVLLDMSKKGFQWAGEPDSCLDGIHFMSKTNNLTYPNIGRSACGGSHYLPPASCCW